ncbi:MAG: PAS domain-containing protein [Deltaproteobacteria bacterium]|nr:PAS domain-containing protein [Deltaproteobacteria bacterium]
MQKKTAMSVLSIHDNQRLEPNHIYILPPDKELLLAGERLLLRPMPRPHALNPPIDTFFCSLAQQLGPRAVGIILSGTGSDGTLGIRALKNGGGLVLAQDPAGADFDGMPASAIATGLVDCVLPPAKMPARLLAYFDFLRGRQADGGPVVPSPEELSLQKIFALLRAASNHDFSGYKRNTIYRRLEKRMHIQQIDGFENYLRFLADSPHEVKSLLQELLIGVTGFFRDPLAWEALKEKYLPELLAHRQDGDELRVWIPGCSSGEEAYSVAMIIREIMVALGRNFAVRIFATDIDAEAIGRARAGIYAPASCAGLSAERRELFFVRLGKQFKVAKNLREMVVFACQDVIRDPPFTRLDLLCCRNLLIYFEASLQKKILPIFRYSLKDDGLLLLGTSETIGTATDLFRMRERKLKIYQCQPRLAAARPDFPLAWLRLSEPEKQMSVLSAPSAKVDTIKLLQAVLSQSSLPPCVVIDDASDILYIHGRTGLYLEPAEGEGSLNLIAMARPGLKVALTAALRQVEASRQELEVPGLKVQNNGSFVGFKMIIRPLPDLQPDHGRLRLVIFSKSKDEVKAVVAGGNSAVTGDSEVQRLEEELVYTRENLQTTIEELETANEELKSTNEELQSTNEELQSTNEELETSKEELQSLNEESATVNAELQSRIDELMEANDDIRNLLDATEIATLFLDGKFNIRRFTAKTQELFPLTAADLGRPLSHFSSRLEGVDLLAAAEKVLDRLEKQELCASTRDGVSYCIRLRPYRTNGNVIDGVVIIFADITELTRLRDELEQSRETAAGRN